MEVTITVDAKLVDAINNLAKAIDNKGIDTFSSKSKVYGEPTDSKIKDVLLSQRTRNVLRNIGINYISSLEYISEGELLRYPNFGRKSLNELKNLIYPSGFVVGSKSDPKLKRRPDWYYDDDNWVNYFKEIEGGKL
jgi:DNA-directed RNA polymerase alpha subunit